MIRGSALAVAVLAVLCWGVKAPADDKKKDEKSPGYIGVMIKPADSGGVEIVEVMKDGPAEKAGLKAGDVIKKAGDKDISEPGDLVALVQKSKPGDKIVLKVVHEGKEKEVTLTVAKKPVEPPPQ